jgi:hypothetical protein
MVQNERSRAERYSAHQSPSGEFLEKLQAGRRRAGPEPGLTVVMGRSPKPFYGLHLRMETSWNPLPTPLESTILPRRAVGGAPGRNRPLAHISECVIRTKHGIRYKHCVRAGIMPMASVVSNVARGACGTIGQQQACYYHAECSHRAILQAARKRLLSGDGPSEWLLLHRDLSTLEGRLILIIITGFYGSQRLLATSECGYGVP